MNDSLDIWDSTNPDTAVKLTYIEFGESKVTYETEDSVLISNCISALKLMTVISQTDIRYSDAGTMLVFQFDDGETYQIEFEKGNYVTENKAYETEGFRAVADVLQSLRSGEEK